MKTTLLVIMFLMSSCIGFCQGQTHTYDSVVSKLLRSKIWYYKRLENDIKVGLRHDSVFFYERLWSDAPLSFLAKKTEYYTNKSVQCLEPETYFLYKNPVTKKYVEGTIIDYVPLICFIDTIVTNNLYHIYVLSENECFKGELIFMENNIFYIKGINMNDEEKKIQKTFYRINPYK